MALRITPNGTSTKIQFVLSDDVHDGAVSAVGTFNDWTPGAHKASPPQQRHPQCDVAVPKGQSVRFRYLGEGGVWFTL
jgi:hypothetical protein